MTKFLLSASTTIMFAIAAGVCFIEDYIVIGTFMSIWAVLWFMITSTHKDELKNYKKEMDNFNPDEDTYDFDEDEE